MRWETIYGVGGGERISFTAVVIWHYHFAFLQRGGGARRVFIDRSDTVCTKREAPVTYCETPT